MSNDMIAYTKAYQELEESILIALDDAYSDGVDMDEAFVEIMDYINASGCGDQTKMLEAIYADWKKDRDIGCGVLQGSF